MGCVLCLVGSQGWASESTGEEYRVLNPTISKKIQNHASTNEIVPLGEPDRIESSASDIDQKSENSESSLDETSGDEPIKSNDSILIEENSSELSEEEQKLLQHNSYQTHYDTVQKVSEALEPFWKSKLPLNDYEIQKIIDETRGRSDEMWRMAISETVQYLLVSLRIGLASEGPDVLDQERRAKILNKKARLEELKGFSQKQFRKQNGSEK